MDARSSDLSLETATEPTAGPSPAAPGWRARRGEPSLSDVFGSVRTARGGSFWRKLLAFLGPGYLVAVGYMDPGNWATSLAGGSKFGYALLTVALISNVMAIVLQSLCTRLGVGAGRDLAQACRDSFPRWVSLPLWLSAEVAITATDLAEVIGTAIGLNLLFHIPLEIGVVITALDVFLILALQAFGFRWIEAFVVAMLGVIAACFAVQIALADPDWGAVIRGFLPSRDLIANREMLYLALGILGATVMPHNLYLHSSIVQTRKYRDTNEGRREAIRFASIDSAVALMSALFINAAILVMAAASFHGTGHQDVADISDAYQLLAPLLGTTAASALFAVALLCSGQNATLTGTLAGQIVMEGFMNLRLRPWLRRLITRLIAIVPAIVVIGLYGDRGTGPLLILSQVVLSLQLPFAVFPLVSFTSDPRKMGPFVSPRWLRALAWSAAFVIAALNGWLLYQTVVGM